MVVNADDLDVKNMTKVREKMHEVFKFAGLCPYDIPDMKATLLGKNSVIIYY
jgi:hypothetical protein